MSETAETAERIEEALKLIHGDPETFRPMLQPAAIVRRLVRTAKARAASFDMEAWAMVSRATGHGSGVSNAIVHAYGDGIENERRLAYAFQPNREPIDRGSIGDTPEIVKDNVLRETMGWRYDNPSRFCRDEAWARIAKQGRIVSIRIEVEGEI